VHHRREATNPKQCSTGATVTQRRPYQKLEERKLKSKKWEEMRK
jgi:hypothetical protein